MWGNRPDLLVILKKGDRVISQFPKFLTPNENKQNMSEAINTDKSGDATGLGCRHMKLGKTSAD